MFKHILVPTDGSSVSRRAARAAIALATETGARVTAYHCRGALPRPMYGDGYVPSKQLLAEFERRSNAAAKKCLAPVIQAAREAGVECTVLVDRTAAPHEGIVNAAGKRKCDLIFIGTHGYGGLTRLVLGSVAEKVTRLSKVPVLVYR